MACSGVECMLDASQAGSWPSAGFCIAADQSQTSTSGNYVVSADIKNIDSKNGQDFGHIGLAYNMVDFDNFDFIYYR